VIRTTEHDLRAPKGLEDHPAAWAPAMALAAEGVVFAMPLARSGVAVSAYINWGRWVADCAFCASAQVVTPDDARMWCPGCRNADVNGAWVRVAFPRDRAGIEEVLVARREVRNRNWDRETLDELRQENRDHGEAAR
jgi:hypothetical protein